jgi:hypothetical protein
MQGLAVQQPVCGTRSLKPIEGAACRGRHRVRVSSHVQQTIAIENNESFNAPSRRAALAALVASIAAAAASPAAAAAAAAADGDDDADDFQADFYTRWPYAQPSDILPWVRAKAAPGDAAAVLSALDEWAT